ncbi:MAG: ParB/RepB/Spo0J family partition protein [Proteobacteria bacterium]|nr:ParB/RepB/Spo0J family partition protein [Pseudomonadota bacterium]
MATKKISVNPEVLYIPVDKIVVMEQVRSSISIETDSFKSLMQSIKDKGILEPLIVTAQDDGTYLLICGERRLVAARQLGLESVPIRIIEAGKELGETVALQLTENLQREDLNPIDQAKGILLYIQAKHPDKGYDVGGVMSELVNVMRTPDYASEGFSATVAETLEIVGKSIKTLFNIISLLKLSPEIQAEIRTGNLPVSQGYLFAANLECPDLKNIFDAVIKTPVTNATLERMLTAYKKVKPASVDTKPIPVKRQVKDLVSIKTNFDKGIGTYIREDVEKYLYELQVFCNHVQQQMFITPYGKKRPPQV